MGEHRILSAPQEREGWTVFVPEIALGDRRYPVPVSVLTFLLGAYPALPPVVMTQGGHYVKAFVYHQSPVALKGSGILKKVNMVREHQNRKVT